MTSRATFLESFLGAVKFYHSQFFHVFENCFGPPHAGELKYEHIPRILVRTICCILGPNRVKFLTPRKWLEWAELRVPGSTRPSHAISDWLPRQIANFTTWPRYIPTVQYPPPPTEVVGTPCRITYYGHSGVLIQTQESNVLIDPFFGLRCGPRYVMGRVQVAGFGSTL